MSAQHTPGRLSFKEQGEANQFCLLDDTGKWYVVALLMNGEIHAARQEANMRRLVACWNACDGVPTETLEAQAK